MPSLFRVKKYNLYYKRTTTTFLLLSLLLLLLLALITGAAAFSQATPKNSVAPGIVSKYEVCLSPGCVADGAKETLQKLQALAPPGIVVTPGDCCSLCGNGPIVLNTKLGDKYVFKNRRVKGDKIIELFATADEEEGNSASSDLNIPENLIQGYDISIEASKAFETGDFKKADMLYENAIDTAFRSAMELQTAREKAKSDRKSETGIPVGLLWLVNARRNQASARLALGDVDGAVLAAQASCNLARNRCPESLEVLAEVYQKKGDFKSELQALNNMFDLPVNEEKLPRQVSNRRRVLGFRQAKLKNEIGK